MNWKTGWFGNSVSLSGSHIWGRAGDERHPDTVQCISHDWKAGDKIAPSNYYKCCISDTELAALDTECSVHHRATTQSTAGEGHEVGWQQKLKHNHWQFVYSHQLAIQNEPETTDAHFSVCRCWYINCVFAHMQNLSQYLQHTLVSKLF